MLVDFTQKILDIDNNPILVDQSTVLDPLGRVIIENGNPKMTGGKPLTLDIAVATALQNNYQDEQNLEPTMKLARFMLALKVYKSTTPVEVTIEELGYIKTVLNKQYGTLVYARAAKLLEKSVVL